MPDSRFFEDLGPVSLAELAALTGAELPAGAPAVAVQLVAPLNRAANDAVGFFAARRYAEDLTTTKAAAVFVTAADAELAPAGVVTLITAAPQMAYVTAATRLHRVRPPTLSDARVDPTADLEEGVSLAPGVVVGPGAKIGARTVVGANSVIGAGVSIGRDGVIGPNVTIGCALIGDRVRILAGAVIGEAGFGNCRRPRRRGRRAAARARHPARRRDRRRQ